MDKHINKAPDVEEVFEEVVRGDLSSTLNWDMTHRSHLNEFRNAQRTLVLFNKQTGFKAIAIVHDPNSVTVQSRWRISLLTSGDASAHNLMRCKQGDIIKLDQVDYLVTNINGGKLATVDQAQETFERCLQMRFQTRYSQLAKRLQHDIKCIHDFPGLQDYQPIVADLQEALELLAEEDSKDIVQLDLLLEELITQEGGKLTSFRERAESYKTQEQERRHEQIQQLHRERREQEWLQQEKLAQEERERKERLLRGKTEQARHYDRSTSAISYDEATKEVCVLHYYVSEGVKSNVLRERAMHLRRRCALSRDAIPSHIPIAASASNPSSGNATAGAIIGGFFGLLGGPLGAIAGATFGGMIGAAADGDANTTSRRLKAEADKSLMIEREKWVKLIQEIDSMISKLPAV